MKYEFNRGQSNSSPFKGQLKIENYQEFKDFYSIWSKGNNQPRAPCPNYMFGLLSKLVVK